MDYGLSSELPEGDERQPLYLKQREERGFDDTETWGLDHVFAQFAIPRLKVFKELHGCHPGKLTMEEWDDILQQMIDGFEEVLRKNCGVLKDFDVEKVNKGLDLFSKWYLDLWW